MDILDSNLLFSIKIRFDRFQEVINARLTNKLRLRNGSDLTESDYFIRALKRVEKREGALAAGDQIVHKLSIIEIGN